MGLLNILTMSQYDVKTKIILFIFSVVVVFFSLTVHECSHGLTALALGDATAKERGRLTLNPMKHLNLYGTIMMFLIGFGYAEPVPINPARFSKIKSRKVGMAITALAGPMSNFILALIASFGYTAIINGVGKSSYEAIVKFSEGQSLPYFISLFLYMLAIVNLSLMVFNLIPIPPLDGSRILNLFLPERYYFSLMRYEQYTALIFFAVVYISTRVFNVNILLGIPEWIFGKLVSLADLIV